MYPQGRSVHVPTGNPTPRMDPEYWTSWGCEAMKLTYMEMDGIFANTMDLVDVHVGMHKL